MAIGKFVLAVSFLGLVPPTSAGPVMAADERFTVTCIGTFATGRPTKPPTTEKVFAGTLTVDLIARKWAWMHKPGKTKAIAAIEQDRITLDVYDSEQNRSSQVQYLKLDPLAYSAWRQGHQLSTWVNAPCEKVAFIPLP